ncbi:hypothetical protein [Pseudidiomarina homiensis]|uniref:hypothetical protein n=1 Tax=Pseudidiomarina homiensis TaxID=364198 RepID=UPI00215A7CB1|nr:hypothetical protein [Pseudidiomarina homiensis]
MTNMFKKSLVALALAGVSTGVMAADIATTSTTTVSNEYLEVNSTVDSNAISVTLDDEYTENDFLILTFPGTNSVVLGNLATSISVPSQYTVVGVDDTSTDCNDDGASVVGTDDTSTTCNDDYNTKSFTVDYVLSDTDDLGNTYVKYRVTNLGTSGTSTVAAEVPFGSVTVNSSALQGSSSYDVTYFARPNYENYSGSGLATETGVDPLDTADSASLFATGDQFSVSVSTPFDQTVDVKDPSNRTLFVDAPTNQDAATFTISENTVDVDGVPTAFALKATFVDADVSISGNNMFGWLADSDPSTTAFDYGQVTFNPANCGADLAHTAGEMTFTCAAGSLGVAETLTFTLNGTEVVNSGSFTIDAVVNYSDGASATGSTDLESADLGMWDVNGSVTFIPYMPYSAQSEANQAGLAIDQIIYVTNKNSSGYGSGIVPSISVRYILEDGTEGTLSNTDLGGIKADAGITKITGQVRQALFAEGLLTSSKKVALEIVIDEDPDLIEVYSAYNVGGSDRGWVQNDSQRVFN